LAVTYGRLVVFSGYSIFLHQKTEIVLEVMLNTITLTPSLLKKIISFIAGNVKWNN
jgi:hypothetical protein